MNAQLTPRRREILHAATTVLARQGTRGLTHRAVDREAGLPEGSCSAYFRTRDALQQAIGDFVANRLASDVAALGKRLSARPGDQANAAAEISGQFSRWLTHPELLAARLELTVVATRDTRLATRFNDWRAELISVVDEVLVLAGKPRTGPSAQTLVAAFDGVLLASLLQPANERPSFVAESVEQLLAVLPVEQDSHAAPD